MFSFVLKLGTGLSFLKKKFWANCPCNQCSPHPLTPFLTTSHPPFLTGISASRWVYSELKRAKECFSPVPSAIGRGWQVLPWAAPDTAKGQLTLNTLGAVTFFWRLREFSSIGTMTFAIWSRTKEWSSVSLNVGVQKQQRVLKEKEVHHNPVGKRRITFLGLFPASE